MLDIEKLDVHYGVIPAIEDVSLKVDQGKIVALVGANGAGKSTTLKATVGVLRPKRGTISYNSIDVTGLSADKRVRMGIVLIPEGRQIFSSLTVKENLIVGAYHRRDNDGVKKDIEWIYSLFPVMKERESQLAGTLSGGEQQMLALGRGLMSRPKLLLLDEPSLGLAPLAVKGVYDAIQKIMEAELTILLVEQNVNIAMQLADYVYVMETGRITMQGRPEDVMQSEDIKKAYLGG